MPEQLKVGRWGIKRGMTIVGEIGRRCNTLRGRMVLTFTRGYLSLHSLAPLSTGWEASGSKVAAQSMIVIM